MKQITEHQPNAKDNTEKIMIGHKNTNKGQSKAKKEEDLGNTLKGGKRLRTSDRFCFSSHMTFLI